MVAGHRADCSPVLQQLSFAGGQSNTLGFVSANGAAWADVTVGSWMLAFNVTHFDDRRLCEPACSATSIAVCVPHTQLRVTPV